ncbi:TetR/AcrR family transcriptional regulator [Agreia pratensis]|uniref:Transcriptional regulator, TetR family n=1 Tax=Agreia pratensis TaxID=150121 RepID=A0A1X7I689_9MICO|nr:TetR/AcrR family transcriptional regulator [Agreia pratensis]SMG10041.1 transcriptional regulator, TetR family [Agreia pratensis]
MGAKLGQNNVKGEQTKNAILTAAEQLFAESGYRGASLANIAERAGVTQSGLLHHFNSKDELLVAVLEQHNRDDDALLIGPLSLGGADVITGLRELIVQNSKNRVSVRLFAVLVAESTSVDHPGHDYMKARYDRLRNRLVGALSIGIQRGEIRPDADLEVLSSALIALMDGIQLQWIYNAQVDMGAAFDLVARALVESMAMKPAAA